MEMIEDWYRTFFEGISLDLWDAACGEDLTQSECDLLEQLLECQAGCKFLDIPCGLGRHAVEMSARGYSVTGADISVEALERANRRALGRGVSFATARCDAVELPWQGSFDAAYCLGNSFGYFDRSRTARFIHSVARALRPGGRFVLNTGLAAESILPNLDERNWVRIGDILFLIEQEYLLREGCLQSKFTFLRNGVQETRVAYHFVYTVSEILDFLRDAGLEPSKLLSSVEMTPYAFGDDQLFILAEKGLTS